MDALNFAPELLQKEAHVQPTAQTLVRAFDTDPLMKYVVPSDSERAKRLEGFFYSATLYGYKRGTIYIATGEKDERVVATAIWLGPAAQNGLSVGSAIKAGLTVPMLKVFFKLGPAATIRLLNVGDYTEKLHHQFMTKMHWYLLFLGVEPTFQGKGVGGELLQPILKRADQEGLPCYLETMNPKNVPFYQKHGFQMVHTSVIPKGGPQMWAFRREPQAK